MWQVAVAAAVAGSGLIAKHLFSPNSQTPSSETTQTEPQQQVEQDSELQPFQISNIFTQTQFPSSNGSSFFDHKDSQHARRSFISEEPNGVFWFSSSESAKRSESKKSRCSGKKVRGGAVKNVCCFENGSLYQRKDCGKRVSMRLKRRKTTRNSDCSSFSWGLGLGIIYMMSAGKADISKLSCTIDETAKAVNELKSELNKQKSVPCHQQMNSDDTRNKVDTVQMPMAGQANIESFTLRHPIDMKTICHLADSDYASSVLTEEQQHEGAEMDQLVAELESELKKLPWCTAETSENVENMSNLAQIKRHESEKQSSTSYHSDGVPPAELNKKLSMLLIEQQESHISELESELNLAHSKLQEKEAELQAMKDCVRRLTEFSLSTVSDEEKEVWEEERCGKLGQGNTAIADNATVGTKRAMHF